MWALHSDNDRNLDGAFMRHLDSQLGVAKKLHVLTMVSLNPTQTMY
jgi:hypothetical protein